MIVSFIFFFFFSSRRRHTRLTWDWSSDVCSSDLLPVLSLLMLMGGIAPTQVAQAGLVIAATTLAAGSLGTLVALWREKTFQVLALTVLFLVLYLCVVQALPKLAE